MDTDQANLTFFLDVHHPLSEDHFLSLEKNHPVIEVNAGTEAGSFLALLDHVRHLNLHPDTILYFVEDDYLHRPGWLNALQEGFRVPDSHYVTLYDHKDKYVHYPYLSSQLFITPSCHWRTIPSTTHTFAVRMQTLIEDFPIHKSYSTGRSISEDHRKFCHLQRKGRRLISPIPGFSTHSEPEFASPCIDWEKYLE
jgi:glycosyltransferase involved in cell wall biosynthesis